MSNKYTSVFGAAPKQEKKKQPSSTPIPIPAVPMGDKKKKKEKMDVQQLLEYFKKIQDLIGEKKGAPKRSASAYNKFVQDNMKDAMVAADNDGREAMKIIGKCWREKKERIAAEKKEKGKEKEKEKEPEAEEEEGVL
jgi:hypothetical protein